MTTPEAPQARATWPGPTPDDPVRTIMVTPVASIEGRSTLRVVADEMTKAGVGALVVLDHAALAGILSERDVVRALAEGADPDGVWAADVMEIRTLWAGPDDSIGTVAAMMREAEIRHVPVREGDHLVGIVSIRDVLDVLLPG